MPQDPIPPGSITDTEVSSSAAIQESKLLFNASTGHDHDTLGKQNLAVQISKRLQPTPSSTPNLLVQIAASPPISFPQGSTGTMTAQSVNFSTTLPTFPNQRIDLIYLDSGGLLQIRQGAPATSPVAPSHEGVLPIAEIGPLASSTTAITTSLIKDVRPFMIAQPTLKVQDHGGSGSYITGLNIGGDLTVSTSSGVSTISTTFPGQPNASTSTKGLTRLSVAPVVSTEPIAFSVNDPNVFLADGTVPLAGDIDAAGHDITTAGFMSTRVINVVNPDTGRGATIGYSTPLDVFLIGGSAPTGNSIDTHIALSNELGTSNLKVTNGIGGSTVFSINSAGGVNARGYKISFVDTPVDGTDAVNKTYADALVVNSTDSVKGVSKLSVAAASPSNPVAVGDNDTRVPTQGENDALVGTDGTPSSSNKYVTSSDPRVPTQNENNALVGTTGAGPSTSNKCVLEDFANLPTTNEKAAFVGTAGSPSSSNKFVTNSDTRLPTSVQKDALAGAGVGSPSSSNKYVLEDNSLIPSSGQKDALAGTSGTPGSSNKYVTQTDSILPTAGQNQALVGTAGSPSSSNKYVTSTDPILPSSGQKAALAGSSGTPGDTNRYITAQDVTYIVRDGSRPFSGPIIGVDPTISSHLATRSYVDAVAATASNGAVGLSVSSLSALSALPSGQRIDNQIILVENGDNTGLGNLYYFDIQSEGGGVAPNEGPGNWYPITAPATSHNSLSGLQGGTSAQYFHLTSAQLTGLTGSSVTSLHNHSHSVLTNLSADDHTQYSRVDGTRAFTGTISGVTPTLSAHLSTKGYIDARTPDASDLFKGLTKLSVAAGSPTNPVAFGINDPNVFLSDGTNPLTANVNINHYQLVNTGLINFSVGSPSFGAAANLFYRSGDGNMVLVTAGPPVGIVMQLPESAGVTSFSVTDVLNANLFSVSSLGAVSVGGDMAINQHEITNVARVSSNQYNLFSNSIGGLSGTWGAYAPLNAITFFCSAPPDTTGLTIILGDSAGASYFKVADSTTTTNVFSVSSSGVISAHSNKLIAVATPTVSTDAATKGYADSLVSYVVLNSTSNQVHVTNTTTETNLFSYTLPGNRLAVGQIITIRVGGNINLTTGTATLRTYIGSTSGLNPITINTVSTTGYFIDIVAVVQAIGGVGVGTVKAVTDLNVGDSLTTPQTAAAYQSCVFDTTASATIKVSIQFSAAASNNEIWKELSTVVLEG